MPRPVLIDFRDDGTVVIDPSVYSLPQVGALADKHGKPYVEVLARPHAYRSPINPFAPDAERQARAIEDTRLKHRGTKIDPSVLSTRLWAAAVERFITERYDPLWDSFLGYEMKCDEFNQAIANTPVQEEVPVLAPAKGKPQGKRGKGKLVRELDIDPIDEELDDELDEEEKPATIRRDNTKLLLEMSKTLREYADRYKEIRQEVLRVSTGKGAVPQRASDFKRKYS